MRTNIFQLLHQTAARFPEKVALADDKSSVTFSQWLDLAKKIGSRIAHDCRGVMHRPILVFVDRRIDTLIGFMGVAASGNFYVPIDSKMPAERTRHIIDVLSPVAALTLSDADDKMLSEASYKGVIYRIGEFSSDGSIDERALELVQKLLIDLDPVYSIFTSGSTGVPKGVLVSHRGMLDLADWLTETFEFTSEDSLGNQTPFYFDGSVKDICVCLKTGATLNVIGRKYFTFPKLMVKFLDERKVTTLMWATSAVILIGNSDILSISKPSTVRRLFFAGEAMPAKQLNAWRRAMPNLQCVNLYGPTEVTVDCTYYRVERDFADDEYIPIGSACSNKSVLVFNDQDALVAVDEPGELCVRGTGVSLGYYNNGAKTDEVFVQNPRHSLYEDRVYRTGDIVKYNERGELVFVARKDFQIKHMGNRIELGEIEAAVNGIPCVTNAACIYDKPAEKIVLYYTTSDGAEIDVINMVKDKLPKYMFPNVTRRLDRMPYNANGKVDRIELKRMYENAI